MDVEQLRGDAEWIQHYGTLSYELRAADALLRILDAFDAMEREKADLYYSHRYNVWMLSGEKLDGKAATPLAALLAAAEGKSDG